MKYILLLRFDDDNSLYAVPLETVTTFEDACIAAQLWIQDRDKNDFVAIDVIEVAQVFKLK